MTGPDPRIEPKTEPQAAPKTDLRLCLQDARNVLLWKLEGLSE